MTESIEVEDVDKDELGTARFTSGRGKRINKANIDLSTPTAQIAVLGTDFTTTIDELGRSLIILLPDEKTGESSGKIMITNNGGSVTLDEPYQASVVTSFESPPTKPVALSGIDTSMISNVFIISEPREIKKVKEQEGLSSENDKDNILDVDFLEFDELEKDYFEEDELEFTELDIDYLDVDFLQDILDIVIELDRKSVLEKDSLNNNIALAGTVLGFDIDTQYNTIIDRGLGTIKFYRNVDGIISVTLMMYQNATLRTISDQKESNIILGDGQGNNNNYYSGKLDEKTLLITILLIIAYAVIGSFVSVWVDNEIYINQSGDNLNLNIRQYGDNNKVDTVMNGYQLTMEVLQEGNKNELLKNGNGISGDGNTITTEQWNNTTTSDVNRMYIDVNGNNNEVNVAHGCKFTYGMSDTTCDRDSHEDAGHTLYVDIQGNNNLVKGGQKMGSAIVTTTLRLKSIQMVTKFFTLNGNGAKTLNLNIDNDSNEVTVNQLQSGGHTANITLDGSDPTTLNLIQQGSGVMNYTLTQNCVTLGGCTLSVTQQ